MNKINQEILDQLESKSFQAYENDDERNDLPKVVPKRDRTYSYNGYSVSGIYGTLALFDNKVTSRLHTKHSALMVNVLDTSCEHQNSTKAVNDNFEDEEEQKDIPRSKGLNQDMLMKFDQQNNQKLATGENTSGNTGYYTTASMINSSANPSSLKTAKAKKTTTRVMPSKKYLAEMTPIKILIELNQDDRNLRHIRSQVTLTKDDIKNIKELENLSKSFKMAISSENQVTKEPQKSTNTPVRDKRGGITTQPEPKQEKEENKDAKKADPNSNVPKNKDGFNTPRSNNSKNCGNGIESPMQMKDGENQLDISLKEDIEDESNIELIMHILFEESRHLFKKTISDRVIKINIADNRLAEYLENNQAEIRGCRICECTYKGSLMDHFSTKSHKKVRDELGLKENEDLTLSPLILTSKPGSIENEITKLQESSMKIKYKKIKQQMINKGVSHEVASTTGKDITTAHNKKAMQILSIELENLISPTISDYVQLEHKLNSLISILARKRQEELHLLRKLKIIPWVTEI